MEINIDTCNICSMLLKRIDASSSSNMYMEMEIIDDVDAFYFCFPGIFLFLPLFSEKNCIWETLEMIISWKLYEQMNNND